MSPRVSRARWILLATSVTLAAGAFVARRQFPAGRFAGETELAMLQSEQENLRGNDDRTRDDWRRQAAAVRAKAWTEADFATLQTCVGPGWRMDAPTDGTGTEFRRVEFSRATASLAEWPGFVRLVGELEKMPGLSIVALDMAAGGTGAQRRFTRLAFTVRITWTVSNGNAERAASLAPLPVSPPSLSAPRGRAGAIPSLRRPAASVDSGAGPAAVGNVPSSAPGSGANPTNPEPHTP